MGSLLANVFRMWQVDLTIHFSRRKVVAWDQEPCTVIYVVKEIMYTRDRYIYVYERTLNALSWLIIYCTGC